MIPKITKSLALLIDHTNSTWEKYHPLHLYMKKGKGWEKINMRRYFLSGDSREDNAIQPLMTSLHQFEENIILLETLADIKRTDTGQNKHKFCMRFSSNIMSGGTTPYVKDTNSSLEILLIITMNF